MASASHVEFRAVLLTLLLLGCEATRVNKDVDMRNRLQQDASQVSAEFFQIGTRCGQAEAMADEITTLSKAISEANCPDAWFKITCGVMLKSKLSSLKTAMQKFLPCGKSSPEFQSVVKRTLVKVGNDIVLLLKRQGSFPDKDTCGFHMQRLNVSKAEASGGKPMDTVRLQLFGERCESEQQDAYLDSLEDADKKLAMLFLNKLSETLSIHQEAKSNGESETDELEEITDELDSTSGDDSAVALLEDTELTAEEKVAGLIRAFIWIFIIGSIQDFFKNVR